jgi:sn-glycerol 3-phosphate transport system substrate-binding protein
MSNPDRQGGRVVTLRTRGAIIAAALVLAACGGGGGGGGGGSAAPTTAGTKLPPCPIGAIDKPSKPVEVTFWHAMTRANEDELKKLTAQFNASQSDVHVSLVNQTSYADTFTKYKAGLGSGDLPDLVQIEDIGLQLMIDSGSVLPAQSCVDATHYDLSDHVKRVTDYYTVGGVLWPIPFNVSNPVLYYDRALFEKAGLDPDSPPKTFDEVRAASKAIVDSGAAKAGIALKLDPWILEQWLALAGNPYVNNGNGRDRRATATSFDDTTGLAIFTWFDDMVKDGLAITADRSGFDNLFAVGNGNAAMTIETSAALGTITQVFSQGDYAHVKLGVAPMPGPVGDGGVLVGGAALYISNRSDNAAQEGAWRFASFLDEAASQADWAAGTGYVPIRRSAVTLPAITALWRSNPAYKVAYDQLLSGANNDATAGPVIGDYAGVRDAVLDGLQRMLTQHVAPKDALAGAAKAADEAIKRFDARVGG